MTNIGQYVIPYFTKTGYFVEIGCWQGEHISQTFELEKIGWTGVCVDPFPTRFENRKCDLIKKAVTKDGKTREFIKVSTDRRHGGDVSYFSGFTDSVGFHWPVISAHCDYERIYVDCITFDELKLPWHIDFLSVDTEGSELEIFRSIDFSKYTFGMIMFEHNGVNNGVGDILEAKGYKLFQHLELDDIFIPETYGKN